MKRSGFSLLEVLIVVGVLGILATISLTGYQRSQQHAIEIQQLQIVETVIREAQNRSQTARFGQAWSVACASDRLETYYEAGESRMNVQTTELPNGIRCQPASPVKFAKLTGQPNHAVSFELSHAARVFARITIGLPGIISIARQ